MKKKADVNKNIQLIRCWDEIQQWVMENSEVNLTIPMTTGVVNIEGRSITIEYKDNTGTYVIQKKHYYQGLKKNTLLSVVRKLERPFRMIEELVLNWGEYKKLINQETERQNNIFNFKA